MSHGDALERRFPRRLLLGGGAAAAAVGAIEALRPAPAAAAPVTSAWVLGGNAAVTTDGTNYLGTQNIAPLIFKVGKSTGPVERLRIATSGKVGIGVTSPVARLDVKGADANAVLGTTSLAAGVGLRGVGGPSGEGVQGEASYVGVRGTSAAYGGVFIGTAAGSVGVYSSASSLGASLTGDTTGVSASGSTYGVSASGATGVYGSGSTTGVYGVGPGSGATRGVWGHGGQYGVWGDAGYTGGVRGDSGYVGVWGAGATYGLYGEATATTGQNYGVFGQCDSAAGFAVWANGNAHVTGTLSKAAGSFRIDHPLDPDHQWLSHSFVESPDMMNVYNGNVVLGADGAATVTLPAYFGALNRDFRYQLTCIGGYAPVYVAAEVAGNAFAIAGGRAGLKVSWQVTGIRQDDYAKAHPIVVETPKVGDERGTRQYAPAGSGAKAHQPLPVASTATPAVPTAPAAVPAPR